MMADRPLQARFLVMHPKTCARCPLRVQTQRSRRARYASCVAPRTSPLSDELAFWYVDTAYANPDVEILNAVEPCLATTGGPLILASSPHARRGVLWEVFKRHYGPGGDPLILVAHGATRTLNPSLPQRVVDRAGEGPRPRDGGVSRPVPHRRRGLRRTRNR